MQRKTTNEEQLRMSEADESRRQEMSSDDDSMNNLTDSVHLSLRNDSALLLLLFPPRPSNASSFSPSEVVAELGLPLRSQILLIVFYTMATLLSVVGNVLAIVVFTIGRGSRTDLRWFLINLAGADLIMAVFCMPFTFTVTMLGNWVFTAPMCPLVLFMQTMSVTVSVYTIMAIGVDRFWVVYFPLRSRITKSRSKTVIGAIWVVAGALSSVQLVVGRSNEVEVAAGVVVMDCNEIWPEPSVVWRRSYTFFLLISTYVLPLFILSFTYGFVSQKLWRRTAPGNADQMRDNQQLKSKRKVIKMLVIVVTLFGVCWLPLHAFILVIDFHPTLIEYKTSTQRVFYVAVYYSVHWLAMSNSFVNPIIYGFLNDSFRSDLRWLLCRRLPCLDPCGVASDKGNAGGVGRQSPVGRVTQVPMRQVGQVTSVVRKEWSSVGLCTRPRSDGSSSSVVIEKALKGKKGTCQWTSKTAPTDIKPTKSKKDGQVAHL